MQPSGLPRPAWSGVMRNRVNRIHFIGIGGVGMSGIAEVLLHEGYQVSGSDQRESTPAARLRELGANVVIGHDASLIEQVDVVVTSTAIPATNPELVAARSAQIPVVPRAEMLAELMRLRSGIAIAGTHGKTTTTSLVASVLAQEGMDPTFVIGGQLKAANSNARLGAGEYLVAEADESDASFLHLNPQIAVVTNIDLDHMETYGGDRGRLDAVFVEFIHRLPFYGLAVLCVDDPGVRRIESKLQKPKITYGFDASADYRAHQVRYVGTQSYFSVDRPGEPDWLQVELNMPGRHNILNALAAIVVADEVGVSAEAICRGLQVFSGVARRFEQLGDIQFGDNCFSLIDDYAHHPREVAATLLAARQAWPNRRQVVVFQPHRYSRTRDLFEDFCTELAAADLLILLEVYSAGEVPIAGADGASLARAIRQRGKLDPVFVADKTRLSDTLQSLISDGDLLLTLGAGDIG
ncbi:MAG: UDP-N-acetylmuramate--L-alanine ligase, partial [Gammaproteobacteria bacterium]